MRHSIAIPLLVITAVSSVSKLTAGTPGQWEKDGQSLFLSCEFKRAAHAFEKAVAAQPGSAALRFWLGKSYARLAVVSNPLTAPGAARKARRNLEQAVSLDPENKQYAQELFEFYLDSPEWFGGGLRRAASLLEIHDPPGANAEQIDASQQEHSGPGWWLRLLILRTSAAAGAGIR